MDIRQLIPKNKFDQKVIGKLKKLSFEQIEPIVPELLEWLQDLNWPIGKPIAEVLEPFADKIAPEIIKIFRTNDGLWKQYVLVTLTINATDPALLSEVERIAKFPTKNEVEDETNLAAISILNGDYKR